MELCMPASLSNLKNLIADRRSSQVLVFNRYRAARVARFYFHVVNETKVRSFTTIPFTLI